MPTLTPTEAAYVAAARNDQQAEAERLAAIIDSEQAASEARLNAPGALLDAALWYASIGWPVFPCRPRDKRPAVAHGFKDATADPDQIRKWWRVNPDYNVALPTGHAFEVIDIDGPEGVIAAGRLKDSGALPQPFAVALTPRGRHLYVPPVGQGNSTNLLPKVDYRGAGGYVIAPPSATPEGTYRWATPPTQARAA